ncbi:MAG TPA: 23S rRNA (pseudouridine(1915)-N(3))-methyltransferase RlmH [Thermoanaerobaculia bacterium]|nr:23S rRNA (pseudouridine(1915)-N(3))-methyltransferase RlmH [Thermoanaerobaculia bacterium]
MREGTSPKPREGSGSPARRSTAAGADPPRARAILSRSRKTLPHPMARMLLAEQVYRATATLTRRVYRVTPRNTACLPSRRSQPSSSPRRNPARGSGSA